MKRKLQALARKTPPLSPFVYGCWRLLEDPEGADPARVRAKIDACLEVGISSFDHADIYGGYQCEELFGRALQDAPRSLRDSLQIVTKCGIMLVDPARPDNRIKHYNHSRKHVIASAERSLKNLGIERIDLLLIHRPGPLMDPEELAAGLDRLRNDGKIRAYGVSNFTPSQFKLLESFTKKKLATNQLELHPMNPAPFLDGSLDLLLQKGVRPMAWSPTAGGRIFTDDGPDFARLRACLTEIAQRYGAEIDQILYAWLFRHPSRPAIVLGTNRLERIKSSVKALDLKLDVQDWYAIWSAAAGVEVP